MASEEPMTHSTSSALSNADVLTTVALLLYDDVLALARFGAVCTTWRDVLRDGNEVVVKMLARRRLGPDAGEPPAAPPGSVFGPWFHWFVSLHRARTNEVADTSTSSVVWGDAPQYWQQITQPGSRAATVMDLRTVCWFDNSSGFTGVLPGQYKVIWRVALRNPSGFKSVKFDAYVEAARSLKTGLSLPQEHPAAPAPADMVPHVNRNDQAHNQRYARLQLATTGGGAASSSATGGNTQGLRLELLPPENPEPLPGLFHSQLAPQQLRAVAQAVTAGTWLDLEVGRFTVPQGIAMDVRARMYDTTGMWKTGVTLDVVSLVPADTPTAGSIGTAAGAERQVPQQQQQQQQQQPQPAVGGRVWGALGAMGQRIAQLIAPMAAPQPGPAPPPP